jgi:hypothetical protein
MIPAAHLNGTYIARLERLGPVQNCGMPVQALAHATDAAGCRDPQLVRHGLASVPAQRDGCAVPRRDHSPAAVPLDCMSRCGVANQPGLNHVRRRVASLRAGPLRYRPRAKTNESNCGSDQQEKQSHEPARPPNNLH